MIPAKYQRLVFSFFMSLFMSFIMSMVITIVNIGLPDDFFFRWMEAFYKAFVFAFPIVFFVAPMVHKITNKLIKTQG